MREDILLALRDTVTGEIRTNAAATIHSELLPPDEQRQQGSFLVPRLEIVRQERWEVGFLVAGEFRSSEGNALQAELVEALRCADDLAAMVEHHYDRTLDSPSQRRRYDRDMAPVLRARALIVKAGGAS